MGSEGECAREGEDDWECACWGVYASFTGIRSCGEGFPEEMTSGLCPEFSEHVSYGKLWEQWVESVINLNSFKTS